MVAQSIKAVLLLEQQVLELRIQMAQQSRVENKMAKHDDDNRSQQLNPEHDAYWQSRGEDERPDDWEDQLD